MLLNFFIKISKTETTDLISTITSEAGLQDEAVQERNDFVLWKRDPLDQLAHLLRVVPEREGVGGHGEGDARRVAQHLGPDFQPDWKVEGIVLSCASSRRRHEKSHNLKSPKKSRNEKSRNEKVLNLTLGS